MKKLSLLVTALLVTPAFASAAVYDSNTGKWITTIDAGTYKGASGTITFDDNGYTGPTGVGVNDFQVGSGFDALRVGQVQRVVTTGPDWITPDSAASIDGDWGGGTFITPNMDSQVNFFTWGYTTTAGSTFNNMNIDKAGNYFIAKEDMAFQKYDTFEYRDVSSVNPDFTYNSQINFRPYAISDASGWCGSVLADQPDSLERMAGQVGFDFAIDVKAPVIYGPLTMTQLIPDFVMRSYGSYEVNVETAAGIPQTFSGSAVENNTNPLTGEVDSAYQNKVSFLGAGVIPDKVWINGDAYTGGTDIYGMPAKKMVERCNATTGECAMVWDVTIVAEGTEGAVQYSNAFGGYAFLLRADGERILTEVGGLAVDDPANDFAINRAAWTDYAAPVPEAETYGMMLAGLGLVGGMAVRRRRQMADSAV